MEQNQSSAPWFLPPNTLWNTDGWRSTRKSTSKITVRSAKKQERLKKKKHGTQNQSATERDLEMPLLPSLLTQDVTTGDTLPLPPSQGSPTPSPTSPLLIPNQLVTGVRARWGQRCGGRIWGCREVCGGGLHAESALRGTPTQTRRPGLLSWLQWKCLWFPPSAVFYFYFFTPGLCVI